MGLLGKMLRKKTEGAKATADRLDKKELVEGCIAGSVLMAFADGDCEASEIEAMSAIISANPTFANFTTEVGGLIDKYSAMMKAGKVLGKTKLMREITDVKGSAEEKEEVFATIVSIAEADGEVEPKEMELLKEIGRSLGLNPDNFLS